MKKITLCSLLCLFFAPISLLGQNEFLDPSFGTNGIIFQNYTANNSQLESDFRSIVLQPDGSVLTASNFHQHGANPRYVIYRYTQSGSLDTTFGGKGFVSGSVTDNIGEIELQSDGKIVGFAVGGYYSTHGSYVFRYKTDGSVDGSFGTSGTITDLSNTISAISVQSDDKILVAKTPVNTRALAGFTLVRYKPDGALDGDFGSNGTIDFSLAQANITMRDVISQKNGKILLSGIYGTANPADSQRDIFFIRLNDDGSLDTTFGVGGYRSFNFNDVDDTENILVQSDGKIVFSSVSYGLLPGSGVVHRLMRLNANGDMDNTFGLDGFKIIEYPVLGLQSLKELDGGELLAAGTYETSQNPSPGDNEEPAAIVIARYKINGDLDSTFGNNGYVTTTLTNSRAIDGKLAIQRDGKVLAGTTFCEAWFSCHPHTVVFRYDPEARLTASEFDESHAFLVYPNPFKETVTLDFTLNQPEVLSMDLYSCDGRKVTTLMKGQNFQSGFNSQQLDFPGTLASGIYVLTVSGENETKNFRIVKN